MRIASIWTAAALVASAVGVQDAQQPSAAAVLESLIAQTNTLQSFEAEYALEAPDVGTAVVRMVYRAPGSALLSMNGEQGELWIAFCASTWELRSREAGGSSAAATFDPRPGNGLLRRIDAQLAEGFPGLEGRIDGGAAPRFVVSSKWNEERGRHDADIRLVVDRVTQYRLAYLHDLAEQAPNLALGETELVLRGEHGLETAVDRRTGFLTRMLDTTKEHASLKLVKLSTDGEVSDASLAVPARTAGAKNVDSGLEHIMEAMVRSARERLYTRLATAVDGDKAWTSAQSAAASGAFELFHREMVARGAEKISKSWLAWNQQMADYVDGQLATAQGRSDPAFRKQLRQTVADTRTKLVDAMTAGVDSYIASYPKPPADAALDAGYQRVAECDHAAAKAAFMAIIATPLFQDFDARVYVPED